MWAADFGGGLTGRRAPVMGVLAAAQAIGAGAAGIAVAGLAVGLIALG